MKNKRPTTYSLLTALLVALLTGEVFAQEESQLNPRRQRADRPARNQRSDSNEKWTNRREQALAQIDATRREELNVFLRANMPEMERIMNALQDRHPAQYQRALMSINDSFLRLQAIERSGNQRLYQNALENWKLDAQIKMVTAQLSFREDPALENRLKRLVSRQIENRITLLRDEKARLLKQLERNEANLSRLESDQEAEIERRVNQHLQTSERARNRTQNLRQRTNPVPKPDTSDTPSLHMQDSNSSSPADRVERPSERIPKVDS